MKRLALFSAIFLVVLVVGCSAMVGSGNDLSRKVDYLRQDIDNLTKQQQQLAVKIDRLTNSSTETAGAPAPLPRSAAAPSEEVNLPAAGADNLATDPSTRYKHAFSLMRSKDYKGAETAFARFINRFPQSDLADNAQYWMGECFYAGGDTAAAADAFKDVFDHFPFGNKVPDALYKLAVCQKKLGREEKARKTLAKLMEYYPESAAAAKARALAQKP